MNTLSDAPLHHLISLLEPRCTLVFGCVERFLDETVKECVAGLVSNHMVASKHEDVSPWNAWIRYAKIGTLFPKKNRMILECCMPPLGEGTRVPWGGVFTHGPDPPDYMEDWFRTDHVIPVSGDGVFKKVFERPPVLAHWLIDNIEETGYVLPNSSHTDILIMSFYLHYVDLSTGKTYRGECWPMNPLRFVQVDAGIFKTHDFTGLRYVDNIVWAATFDVSQITQNILEFRLREFEVKYVEPLGIS